MITAFALIGAMATGYAVADKIINSKEGATRKRHTRKHDQ